MKGDSMRIVGTIEITKSIFDREVAGERGSKPLFKGGCLRFKIPEDCDLIVLAGNKGSGYIPYRCLLPHQVYVNDLKEDFEKLHFDVIYAIPVRSSEPILLAVSDIYSLDRWQSYSKVGSISDEAAQAIQAQVGFSKLYDVIDGWYHDQTRHHLVDLDPEVKTNLFDKLTKGSDMADERPDPTDGSANPSKYPNGRNEPCEICGDGGHTEPACPNPSKSETKERKIL